MKRTIKFRAKTINGEWVTGNYSHLEKDFSTVRKGHYISNKAGAPFAYMVRPETVGQYTDFTDINGKEVFEGDVLAMYHESEHKGLKPMEVNDTVVYNFGTPFLRARNMPLWQWFIDYDGSFEVIGNIYDNPKL